MNVKIPDHKFRKALIRLGIIFNGYGYTESEKLEKIKQLDLKGLGIKDLTGIEYFKELSSLSLDDNKLTSINLSQNLKIDELEIRDNCLSSLDLGHVEYMHDISCTDNLLTQIVLPRKGATHLFASYNNISDTADLINFDFDNFEYIQLLGNPGDWWHKLIKDPNKGNYGFPGEWDQE
jgi:hypothetical protein